MLRRWSVSRNTCGVLLMSSTELLDFGLQADEAERIQAVLAAHAGVKEAWVYGSRAKGTQRPGSDLDLVLIGPLNHRDLNQIETELDDLLLPYPLDLSLYSQIESQALLAHISRVGRQLYSSSSKATSSVTAGCMSRR